MTQSKASLFRKLPREKQIAWLRSLTREEAEALTYKWRGWWARPEQLAPEGDWDVWVNRSGRGGGKTRSAAEWIRERVDAGARYLRGIGRSAADCRDVMVEGESGILSVFPDHQKPNYEPSKRRITFHTGAVMTLFTAEEPDQLRGPQSDTDWFDELAAFKYLEETWDMAAMGRRLRGKVRPRAVVTTTPRPLKLLKELVADPNNVVTSSSTYANAENLSEVFLRAVKRKYEGTHLGLQELHGQIIDDVPGALWTHVMIEARRLFEPPTMSTVVVGVDPPASSTGAECGIIVVGTDYEGNGYVLGDYSRQGLPHEWATAAVQAYHDFEADRIVAETNQGGDMVVSTILGVDADIPVTKVHASRGKRTRAEPIAMRYEQGTMHHVGGFPELEDQMCSWVPTESRVSPDRMDALVWAATSALMEGGIYEISMGSVGRRSSPNRV